MHSSILSFDMGKYLGSLVSLTLVWQPVKEKENSELKPFVDLKRMGSARLFILKTRYIISDPINKPGYTHTYTERERQTETETERDRETERVRGYRRRK